MTTNIDVLAQLISTAQAAYADFSVGSFRSALESSSGGFTEKEADEFIDNYGIAGRQFNSRSGFQAILFQEKSGGKVLAIRGSEQIYSDFVDADFLDIGPSGFATSQAVDLYRYWKMLTTPAGVSVSYSVSEVATLWEMYELENHGVIIDSALFAIDLLTDTGLGALMPTAVVDVTGHSLGGNLAYVFASMFPLNTGNVVTINAPGINRLVENGQENLIDLGFFQVDPLKITSVNAEGDLVHYVSGSQPGSIVNISQEVGHGPFDGFANNHSVINGLDSLNLMNLFSKLDPSQANNPSGILADIMRASSNKTIDTYENMLDGLRKTLLGSDKVKSSPGTKGDINERNELYNNMDELDKAISEGHLKYLVGSVNFVKATKNVQEAKYDYGQFLAFYFLTPYALSGNESDLKNLNPELYDLWFDDADLSDQDIKDGKGNFSDIWYQDRAAMLAAQTSRNMADTENDLETNFTGQDISFRDALSSTEVFSQALPAPGSKGSVISFGDASNANPNIQGSFYDDRLYGGGEGDTLDGGEGHDYLEGGAGIDLLLGGGGSDQLYGGAGNDSILGEEGNDLLFGGNGNDTYKFTGQFGRDMIKDSDNQGSIEFNSTKLSQLTQSAKDSIIYYDDIKNPTKKAVLIDEGNTKSLIISTVTKNGNAIIDSGNSVTIKDWNGSNLGITLKGPDVTVTEVPQTGTMQGNSNANVMTLDEFFRTLDDADKDKIYTQIIANAGAGKDFLQGTLNGSDTLNGGEGDDIITGGNRLFGTEFDSQLHMLNHLDLHGTDSLNGDAGNDYIVVSGKNSVVHGGTENDMIRADEYLWADIQPYEADRGVSAEDDYDVSVDNVWADFREFLNPHVEGSTPITFDLTKTSDAWQVAQSITGLNYYFLQRPDSSGALVATTHYGTSPPTFDTTDEQWRINGSSQIRWLTNTYWANPSVNIANYQNLQGQNLFGDEGDDVVFGGIMSDYISGGKDKDTLYGMDGHDLIDGGTEADTINGGTGNDTLMGGAGDDLIAGNGFQRLPSQLTLPDDDIIYGGDGTDTISGDEGNDYLDGGAGSDTLRGGKGNDYLYGGDDTVRDDLYGGENDDIIVIGKLDQADGGSGNNIYIWDTHQVTMTNVRPESSPLSTLTNTATSTNSFANVVGDVFRDATYTNTTTIFSDTIYITNSEGNNTLGIAGLSNLNEASINISGSYLFLTTGKGQQLAIQDGLSKTPVQITFANSVEQLRDTPVVFTALTDDHFLNGIAPLDQAHITSADLMLAKLETATVLSGGASKYLVGGLSNDTLTANVAGSTLIGGKGNDALIGDLGNDTYIIRNGDDNDTITEKGGDNHIKFDKNISIAQTTVRRNGTDLVFTFAADQHLTVKNMFTAQGALVAANGIQDVTFYDGINNTLWDLAQLKQQALTATAADEMITGFDGDDIYRYTLGSGRDVITDTQGNDSIHLGAGITQAEVIVRKDVNNNLILNFADGGSITVANAFNGAGNFTGNAIETIKFADDSTWNLGQLNAEVLKDHAQILNGTQGDDVIAGSAAKDILIGGKGKDTLLGGVANDVYQYALGDGNDVITDTNGADKIHFTTGIAQSDVVARSNGKDLTLTLADGAVLTVKDMFVTKVPNEVDPLITTIINQLETRWISQAETLLENHFGLVGSGDIALNFIHEGLGGTEAAHVEITVLEGSGLATSLILSIDLDDFATPPNGIAPLYSDRIIAHEITHAVMARNMNMSTLPGWFIEGAAEFLHGADERVKAELSLINTQSNFEALFKTTVGSPTTSPGYSVSYIAVKFLDNEIRANGGIGIREVFDQLKTGKTLDQSLAAVSLAHSGMGGLWNNLLSFETHFKATGLASFDSLLDLNNTDTGSIAGSDYGNNPLDAKSVVADINSGAPKHFNLVIPSQFIAVGDEHNEIEIIQFSDGTTWDSARIQQEVFKSITIGTNTNDVINGTTGNNIFNGGKGSDQLNDPYGNDIYQYSLGDGNDVITDAAGIDRIELGVGIAPTQVSVKRDTSNNLVITLADGGTITVTNAFDVNGEFTDNVIETINFLDGSVWGLARIKLETLSITYDVRNGTVDNDMLVGTSGNDIFAGGKGNDTLSGGGGSDMYVFSRGDGSDVITEYSGSDIIKFGASIAETNVTTRRSDKDLVLTLDTGEKITINSMFNTDGALTEKAIEYIQFSNGSVWDINRIKQEAINGAEDDDEIYGFNTDDVFIGGKGNDQLNGLNGNDTYIFNRGDGVDTLTDTGGANDVIKFDSSIAESDVTIYAIDDNDVVIALNTGEKITISNMYFRTRFDRWAAIDERDAIENIQFANGSVWNIDRIKQEIIKGSVGNDSIYGFDTNDVIAGGSKDQHIFGSSGDDTLSGGGGDDYLYGGNGSNHYLVGKNYGSANIANHFDNTDAFGTNEDIVYVDASITTDNIRVLRFQDDLVIDFRGGAVNILDYFLNAGATINAVQWIKFSDGTAWDINTIKQKVLVSTNANDKIIGYADNEIIFGGEGDDTVLGNAGNDVLGGGGGGDYLFGGDGDDILDGGMGNDVLNGGSGSDIYRFGVGSGFDVISFTTDSLAVDTGADVIELGEGIDPTDFFVKNGGINNGITNELYLYIKDSPIRSSFSYSPSALTTDGLHIYNPADNLTIKFFDGTLWDMSILKSAALISTIYADEIYGDDSANTILGGKGNDSLYGAGGDDTLNGGTGNDVIDGGDGSNTYMFDIGSGQDSIYARSNDTLIFGEGISPDWVTLELDSELRFIVNNTGDSLRLLNVNGGQDELLVGTIKFSDGTIWDLAALKNRMLFAVTPEPVTVIGTASNEILNGGLANDFISGAGGADTINGGAGNDILDGGTGNDTYLFGKNSGHDVINSADYTFNKSDVIQLDAGIVAADIRLSRNANDLLITLNDSVATIKVTNFFFNDAASGYRIDKIKFSDNTVWDINYIKSTVLQSSDTSDNIIGYATNDTLEGGLGNDELAGGLGSDTFIFNKGDGHDQITGGMEGGINEIDVLQFGVGISPSDILLVNIRFDGLNLYIKNTNDSISIPTYFFNFAQESHDIELIKFSDGTAWGFDDVRAKAGLGTLSNDTLYTKAAGILMGLDGNDYLYTEGNSSSLYGGNGDDVLHTNGTALLDGGAGMDILESENGYIFNVIYIGGLGDDLISANEGRDIYRFNLGDGADGIYDRGGLDTIEFGVGITKDNVIFSQGASGVEITFTNSPYDKLSFGEWTLSNRSSYSDGKIETIKFYDGSGISFDDRLLYDVTPPDQAYIIDASANIVGIAESYSTVFLHDLQGELIAAADVVGSDRFYISVDKKYLTGKTVYLTVKDSAGNSSQPQPIVTQDYTAPIISTAAFDAAGKVITGVAEAGSTVVVKNSGNTTTLGTVTADATTGAYSITLATALINKETVNLTAKDAAGNVSAVKAIIAPDKTAPALPTAAFDTAGLVITGVAEAGSTVVVKNSGNTTTLGTVTADATTGAYSITLVTALINKETVNVTAKDVAGNISAVKAIIAPDKTAPALPTAAFDTAGKVITGVAEAGSTVVVKNSGNTTTLGTVTANATTGVYSITLVTALINSESVNVTAKDVAGNVSAVKTIIAPDKTAPALPTAAFDTAGKVITGVAEAGSTVVVKNSGNTTTLGSVSADATTGAYSITLVAALINKETVNITAKDAAGNVSAVKAIIASDKIAPSLPTAAFDTAGKVISGVAEAGSTVEVKNSGNTATLGTATANATTGAYTITLTTALINKETVNVTARDAAGNVSAVKAIVAPDKTAPALPTAAFDTAGKVITGIAEVGSTVVVKNNGNTTTLGTVTANATTGAYSITLTTALINKETVNVTAKDVAGNVSAVKAIIAPDKIAPALPTAAFDTAGKVITGVAEAGSTVVVKNSGNTTTLGTVTANATTGAYSITLVTALINKETVNVTAKDAAGNVSAVKAIIAPDKTAPALPTGAFNTAGKIITGVAEAGSTVVVKNSGNTTTLGTVTANATTGAYSVTLATALTKGQTVNITAKDAAGNVSAAKAITAPNIAARLASQSFMSQKSVDPTSQLDSMIQAMAAFAPPSAAESKVLVGVYDVTQPILASQA